MQYSSNPDIFKAYETLNSAKQVYSNVNNMQVVSFVEKKERKNLIIYTLMSLEKSPILSCFIDKKNKNKFVFASTLANTVQNLTDIIMSHENSIYVGHMTSNMFRNYFQLFSSNSILLAKISFQFRIFSSSPVSFILSTCKVNDNDEIDYAEEETKDLEPTKKLHSKKDWECCFQDDVSSGIIDAHSNQIELLDDDKNNFVSLATDYRTIKPVWSNSSNSYLNLNSSGLSSIIPSRPEHQNFVLCKVIEGTLREDYGLCKDDVIISNYKINENLSRLEYRQGHLIALAAVCGVYSNTGGI